MIRDGHRVRHERFGAGTVREIRHGGYEAKVMFQGYAIWVPSTSLERIGDALDKPRMPGYSGSSAGSAKPSRKSRAKVKAGPTPSGADHLQRQIIESLRLGIVPDRNLAEWTVGREEEFAQVVQWLDEPSEGTLLVEGRYGSGKTHLLRYLSQQAQERNWAVSLIRVDPGEENASFPMRFYRSVVRGLRIPYEGGFFELDAALRHIAGKTVSLRENRFLGPFVERIIEGTETDADWASLMGERSGSNLLPAHLDFTTVANLACNLISAISVAAAEDLDRTGLLILVDEVETAEVRRYSYHWNRTLNFLRGLSMVANDDDDLNEKAQRSQSGPHLGTTTGLVYSGHYPDVQYYHAFPAHLKVVLALTECRVTGRMLEWKAEQPRLALSDMDHHALKSLYHKVNRTYRGLYGVSVPDHLERYVLHDLLLEAYRSASIRGFAKSLVEVLDFLRHNPDEPLEVIDAYREF
jgi:hypothetical protein